MTFRKAVGSDLPRILEITQAVIPMMTASGNTQWSSSYPDEARFLLDIESGNLYVYEDYISGIKGFVAVDSNHAPQYDSIEWVLPTEHTQAMHRMAVAPGFQGQGISSKIFKCTEALIKQSGYRGIQTDTSLENKVMQRQFEKNGFQYKGKLHLDDNIEDWYVAYEKVFD